MVSHQKIQQLVKYLVGGGVESNVRQNKIQRITKVEFDEDLSAFDDGIRNLYSTVKNSLLVDNDQLVVEAQKH